MKIGDLFLSLGFQIEGREEFDAAEKGMTRATAQAAALAVAVNAVNYFFLRMAEGAVTAAVAMKNFALTTGLSVDELKAWQAVAVVNDVKAEELTETIKGIQKASTEIAFGRGNIAPWQLLGIAPNQDPFVILRQLRERLLELPPAVGRTVAAQLGVSDNVFQMLRSSTFEMDRLASRYQMTEAQRERLLALNRAWKDISFSILSVRDKLVALLVPGGTVLRGFKRLVDLVALFVDWLGKGSFAANVFRGALVLVVIGFVALGVALGFVAAALAVATAGMVAFDLAAAPVVLILTAIIAVVGIMAGAFVALILLVQDFWTQIDGGKAFFDWNQNLLLTVKNVERLAKAIEFVIGLWDKLVENEVGQLSPRVIAERAAARESNLGLRGPASVSQHNNVRVMVDGSRSPEETARRVGESISDAISDASYQIPVPSY